jgi:hypothetical protein
VAKFANNFQKVMVGSKYVRLSSLTGAQVDGADGTLASIPYVGSFVPA